jgi:hypothetical protein
VWGDAGRNLAITMGNDVRMGTAKKLSDENGDGNCDNACGGDLRHGVGGSSGCGARCIASPHGRV